MATAAELRSIRARKQARYTVRTRHLDDRGEPIHINHLVAEDSPYLLQHAHNPVDWYPWGRAAFDKAAAEDKPVFLSIGYSTCHWCHVMEEESFDDEEVAAVLNRHFVSIKVDREQRPDLDEIYMAGVQIVTGRGGWPMSSFLTPEGKPFFGATYFPKPQFLGLLEQVHQAWTNQRERVLADAQNLDAGIRRELAPSAAAELPDDLVDRVVEALIRHADSDHGGFGDAPKFPQEPNLALLAEHVARDVRPLAEQPAWAVLQNALDGMAAGGIYDQVGGGFHRYATDAAWRVPHFEKMLYNQGQLAEVYLAAWQLCGAPDYRRITEETLDYVLREMRAPDGGFYSATDADSEGEEGRYFVWRYDELAAVLDGDALTVCEVVFGASRGGNFEGANILHRPQSLDRAAERLGLSRRALDKQTTAIRRRLHAVRAEREAPLRDDKRITEWNGMMIAALARAAGAFGRTDYLEAAVAAADFLWQTHHDDTRGALRRTSLAGEASGPAQLEDYAHLLAGLVALFDATRESRWLERARRLLDEAVTRHWDDAAGGFFVAAAEASGPQLLRGKSLMDGASVSGNSLMLPVLIALYERSGDADLRDLAERQIAAFSGHITELPLAGPVFLQGLCRWRSPTPGPLQYLADGAVRVACRSEALEADRVRVTLTLDVAADWHLQPADDATSESTRLAIVNDEAWRAPLLAYPRPDDVSAADATLAGLTGRNVITLEAARRAAAPLVLELALQPCSGRACRAIERRRFVLHAPTAAHA